MSEFDLDLEYEDTLGDAVLASQNGNYARAFGLMTAMCEGLMSDNDDVRAAARRRLDKIVSNHRSNLEVKP